MKELSATGIIWSALGKPQPWLNDGTPIKSRGPTGICAHCGEPAEYKLQDAISDNFTTVKNNSRAWPFGGDAACAACVIACKWLGLRAGLWFARENGLWFVPMRPIAGCPETRPDPLSALLNPPEPPFVAGLPLYGIDHGTEANAGRIVWPGAPVPSDPLIKCQSKNTALYAQTAFSRTRYPLQVDDAGDLTVDVPLWKSQSEIGTRVLRLLRADGVGAVDARESLISLRPPHGTSARTVALWKGLVAPLQSHAASTWWELVVSLLEMPALVIEQAQTQPRAAKKSAKPVTPSKGVQGVLIS